MTLHTTDTKPRSLRIIHSRCCWILPVRTQERAVALVTIPPTACVVAAITSTRRPEYHGAGNRHGSGDGYAEDIEPAQPGNRFETLSGDRKGQYSIRINDQWRICFVMPSATVS